MATKRRTTVRVLKLIDGLVAGKPVAKAAKDANFGGSPETARVEAYRALQKPHNQEALKKALEDAGLSLELMAKKIAHGIAKGKIGGQVEYLKMGLNGFGALKEKESDGGSVDRVFIGLIAERKSRGLAG